jgi:hypothetical protein
VLQFWHFRWWEKVALREGGFDGVDLGVQTLKRQPTLAACKKPTITGTRTLKRRPIITAISRPLFTKDVGASDWQLAREANTISRRQILSARRTLDMSKCDFDGGSQPLRRITKKAALWWSTGKMLAIQGETTPENASNCHFTRHGSASMLEH